jgi:hypothetical protein
MKTQSKLRLFLHLGAALIALGAGALAVEPSATLFENEDVKVARALEKAHVKGGFHEHKNNRVMVYLQPGHQRFEYQDGRKPAVFEWKTGQVVWSPYEGMHSPEVVSDEPFNIIEVEIKKPGTGLASDAVSLDGTPFSKEFENAQVRVLRLRLAAHQAVPVLARSRKSVAVFLTDQDVRTTDAQGTVQTATRKMGEAVWQMPGSTKIENAGDKPLEMVMVELKY